jgi:hypothetical protein
VSSGARHFRVRFERFQRLAAPFAVALLTRVRQYPAKLTPAKPSSTVPVEIVDNGDEKILEDNPGFSNNAADETRLASGERACYASKLILFVDTKIITPTTLVSRGRRTPVKRNFKKPEPGIKPYRVRLPGFLIEEEIGLGDVIKRTTYAVGIVPCGGCEKRAATLNRWIAFSK